MADKEKKLEKESVRKIRNRKRVRQSLFDTSRNTPVPRKRPSQRIAKKMANPNEQDQSMQELTSANASTLPNDRNVRVNTRAVPNPPRIIDMSNTIGGASGNKGAIPKVTRDNPPEMSSYIGTLITEKVDQMKKSVESNVRIELDNITKSIDCLTTLVHRLTVKDKRPNQATGTARPYNFPANHMAESQNNSLNPQGTTYGQTILPPFNVPPPNLEHNSGTSQAHIAPTRPQIMHNVLSNPTPQNAAVNNNIGHLVYRSLAKK